jgi:uncharacterized protein (DUF2141 family)
MKKLKIIMLCAVMGYSARGLCQANLQVTVTNIKGEKGNIMVGLFDSDEKFLKEPLEGRMAKANGDSVTVIFENLKPGKYAISVLHDTNNNEELDKNKLGLPKEGFGFSNNVIGAMGPPSFERAIINLMPDIKDLDIGIKMKYM